MLQVMDGHLALLQTGRVVVVCSSIGVTVGI